MIAYTYPFNKAKDLMILQNYLKGQGIPDIEGISSTPDNTQVHLSNELDESTKQKLDNLMDTFNESSIEVEGFCQNILTVPMETSNVDWTLLFSWNYPGRNSMEYQRANISSVLRNAEIGDIYSLRAYDATNNKVIFNVTYSNSDECPCDGMQKIIIDKELMSYDLSMLELHGKVSSSKSKLHVRHMCIVSPKS